MGMAIQFLMQKGQPVFYSPSISNWWSCLLWHLHGRSHLGLQLFQQRLFRKSVKAYATTSIGIMGSKSLVLLDWGTRWFSNKKREKKESARFCRFLPPRWNTSSFNQATVEITITHNNFRHCRVSFSPFVRQPFSKQLYAPFRSSYWTVAPLNKIIT